MIPNYLHSHTLHFRCYDFDIMFMSENDHLKLHGSIFGNLTFKNYLCKCYVIFYHQTSYQVLVMMSLYLDTLDKFAF